MFDLVYFQLNILSIIFLGEGNFPGLVFFLLSCCIAADDTLKLNGSNSPLFLLLSDDDDDDEDLKSLLSFIRKNEDDAL